MNSIPTATGRRAAGVRSSLPGHTRRLRACLLRPGARTHARRRTYRSRSLRAAWIGRRAAEAVAGQGGVTHDMPSARGQGPCHGSGRRPLLARGGPGGVWSRRGHAALDARGLGRRARGHGVRLPPGRHLPAGGARGQRRLRLARPPRATAACVASIDLARNARRV